MTLTEFLMARLDEDEAAAKANIGAGLGETEEFGPSWPDYQTYSSADIETAQDYISRFRPTRVLREVEAERKILALCKQITSDDEGREYWSDGWGGLRVAKLVLARMAAVWSDHPDYDEAWRP